MSLTNKYTANFFGAITNAHQEAIQQIIQAKLGSHCGLKVLDLGVGNGTLLKKLRPHLLDAVFTGLDVSQEMLALAKGAVTLTTIRANVTQLSSYLPYNSQDLVLAHFVNAYIPLDVLFKQTDLITRSNGYFSFITTTYESFPTAQQSLARFINQGSLLATVVGHYYKSMVQNTIVATNLQELMAIFPDYHFKVMHHKRIYIPIQFDTVDALANFCLEGTWFLNSLSMKMLPKKFLLARIKRLLSKIFTFPYYDTHIIDIILAKK